MGEGGGVRRADLPTAGIFTPIDDLLTRKKEEKQQFGAPSGSTGRSESRDPHNPNPPDPQRQSEQHKTHKSDSMKNSEQTSDSLENKTKETSGKSCQAQTDSTKNHGMRSNKRTEPDPSESLRHNVKGVQHSRVTNKKRADNILASLGSIARSGKR